MIRLLFLPLSACTFLPIASATLNSSHIEYHHLPTFPPVPISPHVIYFISIVGWTLFYFTIAMMNKYSNPIYPALAINTRVEWDSRVVSSFHAVYSLIAGIYCVVNYYDSSPLDATFGEHYDRDILIMITCGYLTYDLCLCLYHHSFLLDRLTLIHHVLIVTAFSGGVMTHVGTLYMSFFLMNEASTLFLNINFFLACIPELKELPIYKINGILLLISFAMFRVVYNIWVIYHMITGAWIPLKHLVVPGDTQLPYMLLAQCTILSFLAVGHACINLIWFSSIVTAVYRKLGRPSRKIARERTHSRQSSFTLESTAAQHAKLANETGNFSPNLHHTSPAIVGSTLAKKRLRQPVNWDPVHVDTDTVMVSFCVTCHMSCIMYHVSCSMLFVQSLAKKST